MADDTFLQAAGIGAGIAASNRNYALRQQELASQQALRAIQERQSAAELDLINQHAAQIKEQVSKQALEDAAMHESYQHFLTDRAAEAAKVQSAQQQGVQYTPQTDTQLAVKNFGPLLFASQHPERVMGVINGVNAMNFKPSAADVGGQTLLQVAPNKWIPKPNNDLAQERLALSQRRLQLENFRLGLEKSGLTMRQQKTVLDMLEQGFTPDNLPPIPDFGDGQSNNAATAPTQSSTHTLPSATTPASALAPSTNSASAVSAPPGFRFNPVARPPTTQALSQAQQENKNADLALRGLDEASDAIKAHPEAMGIRGIVGAGVERAKGLINPSAQIDTSNTEARQKASLAFSAISKSLRVDSGNMSRYELSKLEQAGDVLSPTESAQTALARLQNLENVVTAKKIRALHFMNADLPNELLKRIPSSEIAPLLNTGIITREDALRWHALQRP